MCEKDLYFEAAGYKNITISWSEKVKKDCKSQFYLPYCEILLLQN